MQRLLLHVAAILLLAFPALAADLPDPRLTPGVVRSDIDLGTVCSEARLALMLRYFGQTP